MLTIMCAPDPRDATAIPSPVADFTAGLEAGVAGMRLGYVRAFSGFEIEQEIVERVDAAVALLGGLGVRVEETALDLSGAREMIETMWVVGCATLFGEVPEDQRELLDPGLVACAARGKKCSATTYQTTLIDRELFASRLNLLYRDHDLLVMPVMPIAPFRHGHDVPPGCGTGNWLDWTPLTYPFNLSHQPAASVPCGLTGRGLPAAFQIVGRRFADAAVLRVARAYEEATRSGRYGDQPHLAG
jgi:aspartyl-tRNA(Asn)/glutamyl-tRNA(Gln) amidotransferase subunit A